MSSPCLVMSVSSSKTRNQTRSLMPRCRVQYCRFQNTHVTLGHQCGICKEYGHGQMEHGNLNLIQSLRMWDSEVLPANLRCTATFCNERDLHTLSAHICQMCSQRGNADCCQPTSVATSSVMTAAGTCPTCKQIFTTDLSLKVFTGSACIICYDDKPVSVYSCGHANICAECTQKLA